MPTEITSKAPFSLSNLLIALVAAFVVGYLVGLNNTASVPDPHLAPGQPTPGCVQSRSAAMPNGLF